MEDEEKKKWSRWIRSKLRPRYAYLYRALTELRWKDTDRSGDYQCFCCFGDFLHSTDWITVTLGLP